MMFVSLSKRSVVGNTSTVKSVKLRPAKGMTWRKSGLNLRWSQLPSLVQCRMH